MQADPQASELGRKIKGRYTLVRRLGGGGQATTYEATDDQGKAPVAVKEFRVRGAASWKDVELAEREARVLRSLAHPALPRYIDHFEEEGRLYLVMEKVEGESLASLQQRGTRFGSADISELLRASADVLGYLHGLSPPVIHRDIKPSNVIRRPDGSYALVDFGAVRDRLRPDGGSTVVGTFGFMAPEQFQGRAAPATDVYAVGVTCMTLLTGLPPEELPHKGLGIDVSRALAGLGEPGVVVVLAQMLEPDPDRRARRIPPFPGATARGHPPRRQDHRRRPSAGQPGHRSGRDPFASFVHALVFAVIQIGLSAAQVAVAVVLGIFVPLLLTLLSIVFSPRLRHAAHRVREAGRTTNRALREAQRSAAIALDPRRAHGPGAEHGQTSESEPRVRVDQAARERVRVEVDFEEESVERKPDRNRSRHAR
jgi:hypothetical protein